MMPQMKAFNTLMKNLILIYEKEYVPLQKSFQNVDVITSRKMFYQLNEMYPIIIGCEQADI